MATCHNVTLLFKGFLDRYLQLSLLLLLLFSLLHLLVWVDKNGGFEECDGLERPVIIISLHPLHGSECFKTWTRQTASDAGVPYGVQGKGLYCSVEQSFRGRGWREVGELVSKVSPDYNMLDDVDSPYHHSPKESKKSSKKKAQKLHSVLSFIAAMEEKRSGVQKGS